MSTNGPMRISVELTSTRSINAANGSYSRSPIRVYGPLAMVAATGPETVSVVYDRGGIYMSITGTNFLKNKSTIH